MDLYWAVHALLAVLRYFSDVTALLPSGRELLNYGTAKAGHKEKPGTFVGIKSDRIAAGQAPKWYVHCKTFAATNCFESRIVYNHPNTITSAKYSWKHRKRVLNHSIAESPGKSLKVTLQELKS